MRLNGRAAGHRSSEFDPTQLRVGTLHETEHTSDLATAQRIAMDHLIEDPNYYRKLKAMALSNSNYEYTMLPGARLEVGPHGRLEEQLGAFPGSRACCSDCASGQKRCGGAKGLGDFPGGTVGLVAMVGVLAIGAYVVLKRR